MVATSEKSSLGIGIYTPSQAAYLARVKPEAMSRWIHGADRGRPAVRAQLADNPDRTVTFLDFVQAMAIRAIRRERRIPLTRIREFVDHVESRYKLRFPFARQHTTYLFEDDIVLKHGEQIIQITGKYKDQDLIKPVVELYLEDLSFVDDIAVAYTPLRDGDRYVLIDPRKRLGHPLIMPCGYSVDALINSFKAEGTIEAAARINAVEPADIRLAQRYEDILAGVGA